MTRIAAFRTMLPAIALATLGCTTSHMADALDTTPPETQPMYTVTISRNQPARVAAESLTIALVSIKDDRCPEGVNCLWAGHAAVTLEIGKAGAGAKTIVIGTDAPPNMGLPHDATYENYTLHLVKLEPGNTQSPDTPYRATVQVSPALQKNPSEAQPLDR